MSIFTLNAIFVESVDEFIKNINLEKSNEIDALGIEDILFNGAVLIEWADKIKNRLVYV